MRGFYTDPSRADDSFIPFRSGDSFVGLKHFTAVEVTNGISIDCGFEPKSAMAFSNCAGSSNQEWMLYHDFVTNIDYEYYGTITTQNQYGFFSANENILTYKVTRSLLQYPTDIIVFSAQALAK